MVGLVPNKMVHSASVGYRTILRNEDYMMSKEKTIDRRHAIKLLAGTSMAGFSAMAFNAIAGGEGVGAMIPGKGWVEASGNRCDHDGTPLQFMPKTAPDPTPLENELEKYPACPYCGMNRTKWNHSRHLVQYDDDLVDGTCSLHCLAISLSLNIDRGPKAIFAADFASTEEIKPLVNVDQASYLVGSRLPGTMAMNSKMAFASADAAKAAQGNEGGELADFDQALKQAYLDMATDTMGIRKRRSERRAKMMKKNNGG